MGGKRPLLRADEGGDKQVMERTHQDRFGFTVSNARRTSLQLWIRARKVCKPEKLEIKILGPTSNYHRYSAECPWVSVKHCHKEGRASP